MVLPKNTDLTKLAEQFWNDGYLIVRQLFTLAEVESFRKRSIDLKGTRADLLCDSQLRDIVLDDEVLAVARAILGEHDLIYFGDSSINIGPADAGFHKDNPDKSDAAAPDWRVDRYPIIRMGFYTSDHSIYPEGLDLRHGSHKVPSVDIGDHVQPDTRIGDVIFWNFRTSHSGSAMKLFGRPLDPASIFGKIMRRLPAVRDKQDRERVAIFCTFACQGEVVNRYIDYLKTREYAVEGWLASEYDMETIKLTAERGLVLRDMPQEISITLPVNVTKHHVPPHY